MTIKFAEEEDIPLILQFIKKLADYEKLLHEVVATERLLKANLFKKNKRAEVVFAYENEKPVGFALFFHNFSSCNHNQLATPNNTPFHPNLSNQNYWQI